MTTRQRICGCLKPCCFRTRRASSLKEFLWYCLWVGIGGEMSQSESLVWRLFFFCCFLRLVFFLNIIFVMVALWNLISCCAPLSSTSKIVWSRFSHAFQNIQLFGVKLHKFPVESSWLSIRNFFLNQYIKEFTDTALWFVPFYLTSFCIAHLANLRKTHILIF